MPEFPTSYLPPSVEPSSPNEPQPQTEVVLRKPWLHLFIFSIANAILVSMMLGIFNAILLSSLVAMAVVSSIFTILGASFLSVHLLLITFEIFLAVLGFFLIYRKYTVAIPKIVIIVVIGAFAYGGVVLPHYIAQTQETVDNPVQVGEQHFDFSDDTIINSRKSAKNTLAISDNAVVWIEHTKEAPPYADNVWDLFLFVFDKDSGRGETMQLTDAENNISKSPDTAIIDGNSVYWTVDATLYKYDISTRKKESIRENTSGIYGVSGNKALVSGVDEDENGGVSSYGVRSKGFYLIDLSTKAVVKDLSEYERGSRVTGVVGSDAYCPYDYTTGVVSIVPLDSDSAVLDIHLPYTAEYSNDIVTCSSDSVVFVSQVGLRVYDVKTAKMTVIDNFITDARAKLLDGTLYFTGNENHMLQKYNLKTGETVDVITLPQDDWDVHQGNAVYLEATSEYDSNVHLRSLPETE